MFPLIDMAVGPFLVVVGGMAVAGLFATAALALGGLWFVQRIRGQLRQNNQTQDPEPNP